MGVRGLLTILFKGLGGNPQKLINPRNRGFVVSRLYIDAAQYVHKALNAIRAEALMTDRTGDFSDDELIEKTVQLMLQLIKEISPRQFLGIYFDGIPPMAKVIEQRARRYTMTLNREGFNRAKITTGTAFLRTLVERVLASLADNMATLPKDVEVSTPAEQGEGEHKLATRIREQDAAMPGAKVIAADDGDVVIISLLNNFRETYVYIDHPPPPGGRPEMARHGLLSIGLLAERIRSRMKDSPTAIHDFCLLVILSGGNDFLPFIQAARDRTEIMTFLMDGYSGQPLMVNQGREISWPAVRSLIMDLAKNEERLIKRLAVFTKKKMEGKMPALYTHSMDPKTGEITLQHFKKAWDDMLYEPRVNREKLPETLSLPRPTQREIENDHNFSAIQYLQGVSWTLGYMRTGDGPDWYYSSAFPPLYADLARVMASGSDPVRPMLSLPPWEPLKLAVYLLVVLPRSTTEDLFGESFINAFTLGAGLTDLFPNKFEEFDPADWRENMGKAILPPLDLDRIAKVVSERLDSDVIESNLVALEPRVRLSLREGAWKSTTGGGASRERKMTKPCVDYEVLDPVIPSLSSS